MPLIIRCGLLNALVGALAILSGCVGSGEAKMPPGYSIDDFLEPDAKAFVLAVADGDVGRALAIASAAPGGVNTLGVDGQTALLVAVANGDRKMVKALLDAGADPNAGPERTPLHPAVRYRDTEVLEWLIAAGANPNHQLGQETPLYLSAMMNKREAAEKLIAAGADANLGFVQMNRPPMYVAANGEHWSMVLYLMDVGGRFDIVARGGGTVPYTAYTSRISDAHPEREARDAVIERIRGAGYPWPPPSPRELK